MSQIALSGRQLQILQAVLEGAGEWDARRIDVTVHVRYGPGDKIILHELEALEALGLVKHDNSRAGVGGRWEVTDSGLAYLT